MSYLNFIRVMCVWCLAFRNSFMRSWRWLSLLDSPLEYSDTSIHPCKSGSSQWFPGWASSLGMRVQPSWPFGNVRMKDAFGTNLPCARFIGSLRCVPLFVSPWLISGLVEGKELQTCACHSDVKTGSCCVVFKVFCRSVMHHINDCYNWLYHWVKHPGLSKGVISSHLLLNSLKGVLSTSPFLNIPSMRLMASPSSYLHDFRIDFSGLNVGVWPINLLCGAGLRQVSASLCRRCDVNSGNWCSFSHLLPSAWFGEGLLCLWRRSGVVAGIKEGVVIPLVFGNQRLFSESGWWQARLLHFHVNILALPSGVLKCESVQVLHITEMQPVKQAKDEGFVWPLGGNCRLPCEGFKFLNGKVFFCYPLAECALASSSFIGLFR